jgi:carbonic anhydrase
MTPTRLIPRLTLIALFAALAAAALASEPEPAKAPAKGHAEPVIRTRAERAAKAEHKPEVAVDPMDRLRERLAEKLGASRSPDNSNVLRVSTHAVAEHERALPQRKAAPKAPPHDAHWDYQGDSGPAAWGVMKTEFGLCGTGKRQSPIDIRDGISVDLEPVQFDYRASGFSVIDNGHTVQVNVAPGNFIQTLGRRWELVQFHFHRPSEERIDGRQFDMVVHLVHKDADGKLAVVAVLLERGSAQPLVQAVWNNLPLEKGEEVPTRSVLDLNHLLPPDRRYYTYRGSLTTPPCSEGVLWMVMRQPVTLKPLAR